MAGPTGLNRCAPLSGVFPGRLDVSSERMRCDLQKKDDIGEKERLRSKAESRLRGLPRDTEDPSFLSPEDLKKILHELRVCQIELEMQNDELRLAQVELEEARNKYSDLYDSAPIAYFTIDEKGLIKEVNLTGASLLGMNRTLLIGKPFTRFIFKDDQNIFYFHRQKLMQTESILSCELRLKKKDGHAFIAHLDSIITKDKDRNAALIRAAVTDITERKGMENALRESNEKLNALIQSSPSAIIALDSDGNITLWNETAEKMFGWEEKEVLGRFPPFIPEHKKSEFHTLSERVLGGEGFHGVEVCRQKKDGSDICLSLSTAPLRDSTGRIDGIMSIGQDITKQKTGEEQKARLETQLRQAQRMEAIGTLAGGIAHDFNNILSAIMGYTELAIDEVPEGSLLEDNLQQIFQGGKRAADLVRQILTFSRQGDEERSPVQVAPLVKEALKLLRSSLPTTIELRAHIKTGLHDVLAEPTQIHQITMNLCTNAAHAMRKDGGILEVDLRQVEIDADAVGQFTDITPGTYLIFTVSDTGHGMSPETLERIFEPYFTTKEKGEGTGMGLSVVHGIVRTYGGTIRAYSEPGKGTTFKVYLPAIKGEARVQGAPILPLPTGNERILFVDDELPLVDLATQGLERLGYEVTPKTSSVEALEIFKAKPEAFDLVITDMTMPEMTGDRLAREMMAVRPDIAVLLCTGYSARISRESAEAMGIKAFVMKPVGYGTWRKRFVAYWMNRWQRRLLRPARRGWCEPIKVQPRGLTHCENWSAATPLCPAWDRRCRWPCGGVPWLRRLPRPQMERRV